MNKTTVVNSFAGPGSGKSTFSGYLFGKLKLANYNVEYVQEFAKKLTWEKNLEALTHQPYISCTQMYMQNILLNQVQAIITDSPILLGLMYYKETNKKIRKSFEIYLVECFKAQNNINFFLERSEDYNTSGRNQTLEESIEIDNGIKNLLKKYEIPFISLRRNEDAFEEAYVIVKDKLDEMYKY